MEEDRRPDIRQRLEHGVALFRSRGASMENKRSAILVVAGILEERRPLIRAELGKPDEGDLFKIANGYSLRHCRAGERNDFDPAFMDWIFWWYLATVELTTRIIERQERDSVQWGTLSGILRFLGGRAWSSGRLGLVPKVDCRT